MKELKIEWQKTASTAQIDALEKFVSNPEILGKVDILINGVKYIGGRPNDRG